MDINFLGLASVGMKLDTVFATIRASIDTSGKVCMALEEKIAPVIRFQVRRLS